MDEVGLPLQTRPTTTLLTHNSHTAGWANDNGDWASQTAAASAGETPNVWSSLAAEFTPSAYQNTWTSTAAYSSPTSSWTSSGSAAPTTWSGATPAYSTSPVWSSYIPTSSLSTAVAPYPTPYASEAHAWETGNAANITAAPTHTMETHTHSSWHDTYGTTVMHSGLATHTGAPIVSAYVSKSSECIVREAD